jgi:hypothetical protein
MLDIPSSKPGEGGQKKKVTALLVTESGRQLFKVCALGETTALLDSSSLNRLAAMGLTERHQIAVSQDGLSIDGHKIQFADPHATEELERFLNPPASKPSHAPATPARQPLKLPQDSSESAQAAALGQSIEVSRDGFEFHVSFLTKFGETKTEKLEDSLALLQNMRVFKPHVSVQKSGIRLVVTRWDGESFIEEPGIENLEHASPEEVEALLKRNIRGAPDVTLDSIISLHHRKHVTRLEVVRKSHDPRLHLIFHYTDGSRGEGPLLIRHNLGRIAGEGIFRPDVSISISALNDRITVGRTEESEGIQVPRTDTFAMTSVEDVTRIEALLNSCLQPESAQVPPAPAALETSIAPQPAAPALTTLEAELEEPEQRSLPPEETAEAMVVEGPATPPPCDKPIPAQNIKAADAREDWTAAALKAAECASPEDVSGGVFSALHNHLGRPVETNEYGFPFFTFERKDQNGAAVSLELVLAPHYLLCSCSFGYLRFGSETRVYLTRQDDYIACSGFALRGVAVGTDTGPLFVVTPRFLRWLGTSDKAYRLQFAPLLVEQSQISQSHDLIWPPSREQRLFEMIAVSARSYGLPVTQDRVVLETGSHQFIGFMTVPPHGMEFRDGTDFVRFTPGLVQLVEEGASSIFEGASVLRGWALDREQRLCALYRQESGFLPPETKLLRFLTEEEQSAEKDSLNILAALDSSPAAAGAAGD